MFVDVLGEDVGDILMLFLPFEDGTIEVVFMEVTGEYIDRLILLQDRRHDTIQVQPIVEYQDGLVRFQHETTMEYVGQRHCKCEHMLVVSIVIASSICLCPKLRFQDITLFAS